MIPLPARLRVLPLAALVVLISLSQACSGSDASAPTPTAPAATPAATVEAAPTSSIGSVDPSGGRALEHLRELSVTIGPRVAGTDGEIAARDYLRDTLESYGYDVEVQEFGFDASAFRPSRVAAGALIIPAISIEGSSGGDVSGPLVDAGIGRPGDFPANTAGAVALIERGELTFRAKVENAVAAGARAVIVYNNEAGQLVGSAGTELTVPAVGITREDGEALLRLTAAPPVEVSVPPLSARAFNVIARPPGGGCTTVTGGHYDSVPAAPAANDNASGTAAVVELARVMAASGTSTGHCFVLFGAEEFGLFGSKAFVQSLSDEEINSLRAMVNIDMVGLDEPLTLIGSDDVVETARIAADAAGIAAVPGGLPPGASSDHASFLQAGVPVVFLNQEDDLIHTPSDAIDRMDADALQSAVRLAQAILVALDGV